jgi:ATP-dependent Lon protease
MTGEITLTGKVLPVGGIKEKVMAARRSHVTCLVLPAGNRKDYDELPPHLREGLSVHFAASYADVYAVAFQYDAALPAKVAHDASAAHPAHTPHGDGPAAGVGSGSGSGGR